MARPLELCIDVMGTTYSARLLLQADMGDTLYTMVCTGTVEGGPTPMTIQDDPCNAMKGQSWTCEVTYVGFDALGYTLVGGGEDGGDGQGPWSGYIPEAPCGLPDAVLCPVQAM